VTIADAASVAARALVYIGAVVAAGGVLSGLSLGLVRGRLAQAARTITTAGAGLLLVGSCASFLLFLILLGGLDANILGVAFTTAPARAFALQLVGSGLLLLSLRRGGRIARVFGALAILASFAVAGVLSV